MLVMNVLLLLKEKYRQAVYIHKYILDKRLDALCFICCTSVFESWVLFVVVKIRLNVTEGTLL